MGGKRDDGSGNPDLPRTPFGPGRGGRSTTYSDADGRRRRQRRDRRPAKRFRGIEAVWSADRWKWRGRRFADGQVHVGPLRLTQDEALEDRRVLDRQVDAFRSARTLNLAAGVAKVLEAARGRGVLSRSVEKGYASTGRYLCRALGAGTPLLDLADAARLQAFAVEARESGRSPNTISRDLWMLSRAFRLAGLVDPVPDVREDLRRTLKRIPPKTEFLSIEQVADILRRIRTGNVEGDREAPPESVRQADADLLQFVALTGIRAGELGRVKLEDVDLEPEPRVYVAEPKDRSHPRWCEVPRSSAPVLRRLVERAKVVGSGLLVEDSERVLCDVCSRWRELLGIRKLSGRLLRHSFVTAASTNGADASELMDLAGHRRVATTSRYVHAIGVRRRRIVEALSQVLTDGEESRVSD